MVTLERNLRLGLTVTEINIKKVQKQEIKNIGYRSHEPLANINTEIENSSCGCTLAGNFKVALHKKS